MTPDLSIWTALLAFAGAAGLLTIVPGLDTLLVLRTATVEGPRRAMFAGLGVCTGCLAWGDSSFRRSWRRVCSLESRLPNRENRGRYLSFLSRSSFAVPARETGLARFDRRSGIIAR